jgi:hypothetical protein
VWGFGIGDSMAVGKYSRELLEQELTEDKDTLFGWTIATSKHGGERFLEIETFSMSSEDGEAGTRVLRLLASL